jgi:restriction system protein
VRGEIALYSLDARRSDRYREILQLRSNYLTANPSDDDTCERAKNIVAVWAVELAVRRKQLTSAAGYGVVDESLWLEEVDYFIEQRIEPAGLGIKCSQERFVGVSMMIDAVSKGCESSRLSFFDDMDPAAYEDMVANALTDMGWQTQTTGRTGDQGVDVIASMRDKRVVIQCKRYSSPVGNAAVQEIFAGRAFLGAHFAAVVSSAGFTRSAIQLAQSTNVILLEHDELAMLELRIFGASSVPHPVEQADATRSRATPIAEILRITPSNYEQFVADGLAAHGWQTRFTGPEEFADVDIIAERDGCRVIIQCPGFFSPIDQGYVQSLCETQVTAGADLAALVTDQRITDDARERGVSSGVILLSHYDMSRLARDLVVAQGNRLSPLIGRATPPACASSGKSLPEEIERVA